MNCYTCTVAVVAFLIILIDIAKCLHEEFSDESDYFNYGLSDTKDESSSDEADMRTLREDVLKRNLVLHYFKNGNKTSEDIGLEANLTESGCLPTDKFAFIFHGWKQDCDMEWIDALREKLTTHRGGCIVCVDYGFFKTDSYLRLLRYFRPITKILTAKLQLLKAQGLQVSKSFMFGFSYGGQMVTAIGKLLGPELIKQIDTCDMAGPGFDFVRSTDHREAAEQVNCWHTSRNKGTRFYRCHQNVRFGYCGHSQPGESASLSSHGLCLPYYINAFDYPFYAGLQPNRCTSRKPAVIIPNNYTVGYSENSKPIIYGDIFVPTSKESPYNLSLEQVLQLNRISRGNYGNESNSFRTRSRRRFPVLIQTARNIILHHNVGY